MSRFEMAQKKLGRGLSYDLAIDFWRRRPCEGGTICLAGPGAHDVPNCRTGKFYSGLRLGGTHG